MKKAMLAALAALVLTLPAAAFELKTFPVNPGARPHDVAVGPDGIVWYTAQGQGALGRLDPRTGAVRQIKLGERSRRTAWSSAPTARPGSPMAV